MPAGRIRQQIEWLTSVDGLHILQWLHANHNSRIVWTNEPLRMAASSNRFETAKWLHAHVLPIDADNKRVMLEFSLGCGNTKMAEWLRQLNLPQSNPDFERTASSGHIVAVDWARSRFGFELDDTEMEAAVINGHTELPNSLHANASLSIVTADALKAAALEDLFEVIEWAFRHLTGRK